MMWNENIRLIYITFSIIILFFISYNLFHFLPDEFYLLSFLYFCFVIFCVFLLFSAFLTFFLCFFLLFYCYVLLVFILFLIFFVTLLYNFLFFFERQYVCIPSCRAGIDWNEQTSVLTLSSTERNYSCACHTGFEL